MINTQESAVTSGFRKFVMNIVTFDPIPVDGLYEKIFGFKCEPLSVSFESMGYEC
jgi:hypothetical protein